MSLSLVIPTYTANSDLEEMAIKCLKSYRKYCDEIIVCEDGQMFSSRLMALADSYIYNWKNKGFTVNVNRGWRYATGDFVGIVSSDTYLISGDPRDLCVEGKVTSPIIENQGIENLAGPLFVVHKSCPKYLIETMKTYYSDEEYNERVRDCFQKVPSVVIHHLVAQSVTVAGVEGAMIADKEAYDLIPKR